MNINDLYEISSRVRLEVEWSGVLKITFQSKKKSGEFLLFQLKRLSLCNDSMPILCPYGWLMRRVGQFEGLNVGLEEKKQTLITLYKFFI